MDMFFNQCSFFGIWFPLISYLSDLFPKGPSRPGRGPRRPLRGRFDDRMGLRQHQASHPRAVGRGADSAVVSGGSIA